jgi:hypothetical protein
VAEDRCSRHRFRLFRIVYKHHTVRISVCVSVSTQHTGDTP